MLNTLRSLGGMMVAPHHLAAQAGRDVLRDGGNAIEAMVAAAAAISVLYPHQNSIGGDGFWLIHEPGSDQPIAIDAAGPAAELATPEFYRGHSAIPSRGPLSALTVAGTVSGWQRALEVSHRLATRTQLPLARLLQDAIRHAQDGVAVTTSQSALTQSKLAGLEQVPGFAEAYLDHGAIPQPGHLLRQPRLARTLQRLAEAGLDDFYRGALAVEMSAELEALGSPLRASDLAAYQAQIVQPLSVRLRDSTVYNLPPPTQGLASLIILGLYDRLAVDGQDELQYVHALVECTKRAFRVRDRIVTDPQRLPVDPRNALTPEALDALSQDIDLDEALPWSLPHQSGDTIWMGCIDREGRAVSFIQSIYKAFGSGVILPSSGVCWQNRGISFSLNPESLNSLRPGHKPFHTLNPALAVFDDGRVMPYGTMGGDGQPQTQAAFFTRYARRASNLQGAITAPRWVLGRCGAAGPDLRLEGRFGRGTQVALQLMGHDVERLAEDFSSEMGHAGAIVRHPSGLLEGAADPRSDGVVAAL